MQGHFAEIRSKQPHIRTRLGILNLASHLIEQLVPPKTPLSRIQHAEAMTLIPQTVDIFYQYGKGIAGKRGGATNIPISGRSLKSIHTRMLAEIERLLIHPRLDGTRRKWLLELKESATPFAQGLHQVADEKEFLIPTTKFESILEQPLLCHLDLMRLTLGRKKFKVFFFQLNRGLSELAFEPN